MGELIIPTKPLRLLTPKSMNHQRYQRYPHSFHALNPIKKQKNMKPLTLLSSWLISSTTCQAHSIKDKSHIQEEAKTSKCRGENLKKSAELVSGLFLQWIYIYIYLYIHSICICICICICMDMHLNRLTCWDSRTPIATGFLGSWRIGAKQTMG